VGAQLVPVRHGHPGRGPDRDPARDLPGNLIAEYAFNYAGLGLLFYNSLGNEDYPVLIAYTLIGAVLTVVGNLVADVALTIADPRVRLR
jgi:peptide/nickel transport system permease protein